MNIELRAHDATAEDTAAWVRRCHDRIRQISQTRPVLVHGEPAAIAEDMSRRAHFRRLPPEAAAEAAFDPPEARQPRSPE